MLIICQLIKTFQQLGIPLDELKSSLGNIKTKGDAIELLNNVLEEPCKEYQAKSVLRVVLNKSYLCAFRMIDVEGSPLSRSKK